MITAASLKLAPRPAVTGVALFVVPSVEAAITLLGRARDMVGEGVSAFEIMHAQGFDFLREHLPELRQPFAKPPEWSVLIELGLGQGQSAEAALTGLFAEAVTDGVVSDGMIAQSGAQAAALWALRENIPEANRRIGSSVQP